MNNDGATARRPAAGPAKASQGLIAREVAKACGSNPVAVLIPCHRVVMSNGTLGGYRWGGARKRTLLALEAEQRQPAERDVR
jgi:AraC family transcriptional regulator of adaptative response/methylated-DNA-[protein]-cysteine methyltransferase